MPDALERLRELDRFEPPDVWSDIERLGPKTPIDPGPSRFRRMAVAVVALGIAASSFLLVDRAFRSHVIQPGETLSPTISSVGPAGNGLIAFDCGYQICTAMPDGSRYTNLIEGYDKDLVVTAGTPVFSSDGSRIAFVGYDHQGSSFPGGGANYDIYVMNADGTGLANLTTSPDDVQSGGSQGSPTWSPDGSMIAYWNGSSDRVAQGVYVMNADGSYEHKVSGGGEPLSWSPDGSRIASPWATVCGRSTPTGTGSLS
jgi:hypothetical protein